MTTKIAIALLVVAALIIGGTSSLLADFVSGMFFGYAFILYSKMTGEWYR